MVLVRTAVRTIPDQDGPRTGFTTDRSLPRSCSRPLQAAAAPGAEDRHERGDRNPETLPRLDLDDAAREGSASR